MKNIFIFNAVWLLLLFFNPPKTVAQTTIDSYEYWFDNDYAGKTSVLITPGSFVELSTAIPTPSGMSGLHMFNLRFRGSDAKYSATLSSFVLCNGSSALGFRKINGIEYWFDNDYSSNVFISISPQTNPSLSEFLDASILPPGLHILHIRLKDDAGNYSSIISQFFSKTSESSAASNLITAFEYWFDNDYSSVNYETLATPSDVFTLSSVDATAVSQGMHIMNIRFKDANDNWSLVTSHFFQKVSAGMAASNNIRAYEYWFDNNYSSREFDTLPAPVSSFTLPAVDASVLTQGLHILNLRFLDQGNVWSQVLSSFVSKGTTPLYSSVETNDMLSFRYWFDETDTIMYDSLFSVPTGSVSVFSQFDFTGLPKGDHTLHFQFLDSLNNWSVITNDTFYKFPEPIASFNASTTSLCDSGWVSLSSDSFDEDSLRWIVNDSIELTGFNTAYNFQSVGVHSVTLYALDLTQNVFDSMTMTIIVHPSPATNLGADASVCFPGLTLNAVNPLSSYVWNDSSTNSTLNVNASGSYSVTVTDNFGCSSSDSVDVIVFPLPMVSLGDDTVMCVYDTLVLDAGSGFASYLWNTTDTEQTIQVSSSGYYSVSVTDSHGCTNADTLFVQEDPCAGMDDFYVPEWIAVFPNPNDGTYFIRASRDFPAESEIRITDLSGRIVYCLKNLILSGGDEIEIDNTSLSAGVYMFLIVSDSFSEATRMIISR